MFIKLIYKETKECKNMGIKERINDENKIESLEIEKRKILLRNYELEHEELLTKFKIIITATISIMYGFAIAFATKQISIGYNFWTPIFLTLVFGFIGIGFVFAMFDKKFKSVRKHIESLAGDKNGTNSNKSSF